KSPRRNQEHQYHDGRLHRVEHRTLMKRGWSRPSDVERINERQVTIRNNARAIATDGAPAGADGAHGNPHSLTRGQSVSVLAGSIRTNTSDRTESAASAAPSR